jgi:ubiquinol-cytochrome c reductase cytochrome c1 subunit
MPHLKTCLPAAVLALGLTGSAVLAQSQVPGPTTPPPTVPAPAPTGPAAIAPTPAPQTPPAPAGVETTPAPPSGPAAPAPSPANVQSPVAPAPSEALPPKSISWSFNGPFGTYNRAALQRGFQVYKEVCSACHALSHVAIRNVADPGGPGFSPAEVAALAAGYKVPAEPDEQGKTVDANGQPLTRAASPADYFPPPFPTEKAARAANNGALPPDLSLIVKARDGHENYVYSILTGFGQAPPANLKVASGLNYNPYFPGRQIAMPPPLTNGSVTFADGTPNTIDEEARSVVTFLSWASEPKMEERKRIGFGVMIFLIGMTVLLFFSYRRVWHGRHDVGAIGEGAAPGETRLAP